MDRVTLLLEEYKALRQECLVSVGISNSLLKFGFSAVAVLLVASLGVREEPRLSAMLLFMIPLLVAFILNLLAEERNRLFRAGSWIAGIETRLNHAFEQKEPDSKSLELGWELYLSDMRENQWGTHRNTKYYGISTVCLFLVLALVSLALANFLAWTDLRPTALVIVDVLELIILGQAAKTTLKGQPMIEGGVFARRGK